MLHLAIVNGPNLNLIGTRETAIYGSQSLTNYIIELKDKYKNIILHSYQSNIEGELINYIHDCRGKIDGIILNGAGYTHTSIALADAIAAIQIPTIEVHISNIYAREEYRRHSITAEKCVGCITGLGLHGYEMAIQHFISILPSETP